MYNLYLGCFCSSKTTTAQCIRIGLLNIFCKNCLALLLLYLQQYAVDLFEVVVIIRFAHERNPNFR